MRDAWIVAVCCAGCLLVADAGAAARPMTIQDLLVAIRVAIRSSRRTAARSPSCARRPIRRPESATPTSGSCRPTVPRRARLLDRRRQEREHAALVAGRPADRVHLDARRRSRRCISPTRDGTNVRKITNVVRRRAAAARVLARRDDGRVRLRRLSRLRRRRVQPAAARGRGQGSGQGARHHAAAVPALGRVARERAASRVRRAGRAAGARAIVTPATSIRRPASRKTPRSRSRPTAASSRSSRTAKATTSEAWTTNNDVWIVPVGRRRREEADAQPRGRRAAGVHAATASPLIVRAQRRPGFESDRWYLDVYDRATGAKRTVFETPDLSVDDFTLSPDGTDDLVHGDEQRHGQSVSGAVSPAARRSRS